MKLIARLAPALMLMFAAGAVQAQEARPENFPSQMVRIVVPFSAGSQTDILARSYADKLREKWKRDVIVENRPGLAGTASAAKAPNDGHTLLLVSNGHAVISSLNQALTFDPIKDFAGVARLAVAPGILVVTPETGPKDIAELVRMAKERPGQLNYASAGLGSASSIGVELLKSSANVDLTHVPYKGLPEAHTSVMRGDALLFMTFYSAGANLIESGKLRPIAVTTAKRTDVLPNIPTMQEAGVPGYVYEPWFGFLAPANTPKPIVDKISADAREAANSPDMKERFGKLGLDLAVSTPEEFEAVVKSDTERFSKIFGRARNQ